MNKFIILACLFISAVCKLSSQDLVIYNLEEASRTPLEVKELIVRYEGHLINQIICELKNLETLIIENVPDSIEVLSDCICQNQSVKRVFIDPKVKFLKINNCLLDSSKIESLRIPSSALKYLSNNFTASTSNLISLSIYDINQFDLFLFLKGINKNKKLKEIELGNYYSDAFPENLSQFNGLEVLKFGNSYFNSIPNSICQIRSLKSITINSNTNLKQIGNKFCELVELEKIELFDVGLVRLPDCIGKLKKLQLLTIISTPIEFLPETLASCPIQSLKLGFNPGINLSATFKVISKLPSLKYLELEELGLINPNSWGIDSEVIPANLISDFDMMLKDKPNLETLVIWEENIPVELIQHLKNTYSFELIY